MLKLYSYWRSSASYRIRIVLECKELEYKYIPIDIVNGQNKSDEFLEENPLGQVPVLVTDEVTLTQSLAIMSYLEAKYPECSLIPKDLKMMGKMWEICEIVNSGIQPFQNLPILNKLETLGVNRIEWGQKIITDGFQAIEKILETTAGTYSIGNELSLADACLLPQVYSSRRFQVNLEAFPIIKRVSDTLYQLPSFVRAHPEYQPDANLNN